MVMVEYKTLKNIKTFMLFL